MAQGDWGKPIAARLFEKAKDTYHPFVRGQVEKMVTAK